MALADGESLASLSEADAYAAARGWSDWAAAGEPVREAKLREATAFVSTIARWPGVVADAAQVLPFPRVGAYDVEGRYLMGTPASVKAPVIEAARLALSGPLIGGTTGAASALKKSVKIGSLAIEYAGSSAETRSDQLAYVRALLRSAGAILAGGVNVALSKS